MLFSFYDVKMLMLYFVVSEKLNFCWTQTQCIDDQDKFQSATDTDNELSNTKEKVLINWHFTCQLSRSYENFKEQYFRSIQSTSWLFKRLRVWFLWNDMKKKVNDLVRLHEVMQEKLKTASYSEQIQILTLVPDKWSRMNCSDYFNFFE